MARAYLLLGAAVTIAFGVMYLVKTRWFAALVGMSLASAAARADYRAIYGGAQLGIGAFLLVAALTPAWTDAGLIALALFAGGFGFARVGSLSIDRESLRNPQWIVGGLELGAGLVAAAIYFLGTHGGWRPRDAAVADLIERHAPGIRIGMSVGRLPTQGYAFVPAPYVGLKDTAHRGADGADGLLLRLDAYVDDARPAVSQRARVTGVLVRFSDSAAALAVERSLAERLGAPVVERPSAGHDMRYRRLSWPGHPGISYLLPDSGWQYLLTDGAAGRLVRGSAQLTLADGNRVAASRVP